MNYADLKPHIIFGVRSGRHNAYLIYTEIGAECWAAPPVKIDDYRLWWRAQYAHNRTFGDSLHLAVRSHNKSIKLTYSGPYAQNIEIVIQKLAQKLLENKKPNPKTHRR